MTGGTDQSEVGSITVVRVSIDVVNLQRNLLTKPMGQSAAFAPMTTFRDENLFPLSIVNVILKLCWRPAMRILMMSPKSVP